MPCSLDPSKRPPVAKQRYREAGRRNHGTAMTGRTPRKGRLKPGKLQLIQSAGVSFAANCWLPLEPTQPQWSNFSTHLLSVDHRHMESRITIATVRVDIRRTCACGNGNIEQAGARELSCRSREITKDVSLVTCVRDMALEEHLFCRTRCSRHFRRHTPNS